MAETIFPIVGRLMAADGITISYERVKGAAAMPTPADDIASAVKHLAESGADLEPIRKAVDAADASRRERIAKAVATHADLLLLKGAPGRRFVVCYYGDDGTVHEAQGTSYPVMSLDGQGVACGVHVLINDIGHPFHCKHTSMEKLRQLLNDMDLVYTIEYYDK